MVAYITTRNSERRHLTGQNVGLHYAQTYTQNTLKNAKTYNRTTQFKKKDEPEMNSDAPEG